MLRVYSSHTVQLLVCLQTCHLCSAMSAIQTTLSTNTQIVPHAYSNHLTVYSLSARLSWFITFVHLPQPPMTNQAFVLIPGASNRC